jgi:hypothetical protein
LAGAVSGEVVLIDKRQTEAKRVTQAVPEPIAL